ncbi:MAG TPA: hypothetical protein VFI54_23145 [Solirubrobacteraceae bacterium]|nr:hypothetical protein [Solirubrobacteraceae bacterium]
MNDERRLVSANDDTADARLPAAATATASGGSKRRSGSPHSLRFLAVTAALVGIAIGAIGVAIAILVGNNSPGPQAKWSSWTPPDNGVAGERDIANAVAPLYRASPASQLAVVTVQNFSDTGTGTQVALRSPNDGTLSALGGTTAVFNLCGLGPNCGISSGTPSADRLLLLRREALELSLYTFKYVHGVENVVSILPPGHAVTVTTAKLTAKPPDKAGGKSKTAPLYMAVAFQRRSLQPFLNRPLRETLPEQIPPTPTTIASAPEAELVSVLTAQALFKQQVIQAQDGSNVLVLDPLPPQ